MPTTDYATDNGLAEVQTEGSPELTDGESKPLRGLFFGFAATVTLGLALATWYVGARIVSADDAVPASAPSDSSTVQPAATVQSAAPARLPSVAAPAAAEVSKAEAYWYTAPPPPALYLQVAGLGSKQDAGYVKSLQTKGFSAQIRAGDRADNSRILIGPFSSHAQMEQVQRKLQSAGILAVEAAY